MTPISSYSVDNHLRVILQGPPGSGKSCLATQFPRPYFIDLDVNLGGPLRWLQRSGLPLPVGYDRVDRDESGAEVPFKLRFTRLAKLLDEAMKNDAIDTVVLDSATNLSSVIEGEVLRTQNKVSVDDFKDGRQYWGFYYRVGVALMSVFKLMRKHVILTAHEKINKTVDGSIVYPIKLSWPGQLGQVIGAFFTDVWRAEVKKGLKPDDYTWIIRTMPDYQYELKNSLGLPAEFKFDWKTIAEKLK